MYDIFKVKNALVKYVHCIKQYVVTIHRLVDSVSKA